MVSNELVDIFVSANEPAVLESRRLLPLGFRRAVEEGLCG